MYSYETAQRSEWSLPTSRPNRSAVPTFEPVTLAEAKKQLEIAESNDAHDSQVLALIVAAREAVERETGIVGATGTFVYRVTEFPCDVLLIPDIRPVSAITSITYIDTAGATQTWSSSNYSLDNNGVRPFVRLAYGASWPTIRGDVNGVTITLVAGYATAATIPSLFKQACLMHITQNFESRDGMAKDLNGYQRVLNLLMRSSYP